MQEPKNVLIHGSERCKRNILHFKSYQGKNYKPVFRHIRFIRFRRIFLYSHKARARTHAHTHKHTHTQN